MQRHFVRSVRVVWVVAEELCRALAQALLAPLMMRTTWTLARAHRTATNRISGSSAAGALLAVLASALIAGAITVLTATDEVAAGAQNNVNRRPIGPECSQQPWPYYEARCVRDLRPLEAQGRTPRVVTTDR
jgi:hypothetical protein